MVFSLLAPLLFAQRGTRPLPIPQAGAGYLFSGVDAQQESLAEIARLWDLLFSSPLYHDVITVYAAWFAVACTFIFAYRWLQTTLNSQDPWHLEQIGWSIIVVGLLSNHAALATTVVVGLHDAAITFNQQAQERVIAGENAASLAQQAVLAQVYQDVYEQAYTRCMQNPGTREARCKQSAQATAREAVDQQRPPSFETLSLTGQAGMWVLRELFDLIRAIYLWLIEIGLLVMAMLLPLSLALSLVAGPQKAVVGWLSAFLGHSFIGKLTYIMITAIAGHIYLNVGEILPSLVLPFLLGPFAAIAAFYMGERSGTAIYGALAGASVFTSVRLAVGGVRGGVNSARRRLLRR